MRLTPTHPVHKRPAGWPPARPDQVLRRQSFQRFADRRTGYAEPFGQLLLTRQTLVRHQIAGENRFPQSSRDGRRQALILRFCSVFSQLRLRNCGVTQGCSICLTNS